MIGEAISVFDKWVRRGYITEDEFNKVLGKFFTVIEEGSSGFCVDVIAACPQSF